MPPAVALSRLSKTYASGLHALKAVDLEIRPGEVFALLGENGAGKTTLISIVCGLVRATSGTVRVAGHDIVRDFRAARASIGLVPQELTTDAFETVANTVAFSRGLFGHPRDPARVEAVLRDLALWDKRDAKIMTLSGGMKRRVLIAKALAHEPRVLFLDEPTAGVDVELRRGMWEVVRRLKAAGVTIVLTTHYLEEAEEMADRIGVMRQGELILVEEKAALMRKLGRKKLVIEFDQPLTALPEGLTRPGLALGEGALVYTYDPVREGMRASDDVAGLLDGLSAAGLRPRDLRTEQSSLEEIFVGLVGGERPMAGSGLAGGER